MSNLALTQFKIDEIFQSTSSLCSLPLLQNEHFLPFNNPLTVEPLSFKEPFLYNSNHCVAPIGDKGIALHRDARTLNMLQNLLLHSQSVANPYSIQAQHCAFTSDNSKNTVNFDTDSVSIILDTGATAAFTFCMTDFSAFKVMNSKVNGLGSLHIRGIGTVQYSVINDTGKEAILSIDNAYYVPDLKTRLISPQQICAQHKSGTYSGTATAFAISWGANTKTVEINSSNNLPIMHTASGLTNGVSLFKALQSGPISTSNITRRKIPIFGAHNAHNQICVNCSISHCPDCMIKVSAFTSTILDMSKVQNMTDDQRELLHLHESVGHLAFGTLISFARKGLLPAKFKSIDPPTCITCILGKQHKLSRSRDNKISGKSITQPGDLIHMDQCIVTTPGRPMTLSGKNNRDKITCFTIYVDQVSHRIHIHFQSSTDAKQTLQGKHRLEKYGHKFNVNLKHFRADNGVFKSKDIMFDIEKQNQDISFCGVNAHHQNGVAERHIRTVVERGRTNFIHAATKWPKALPTDLWTFAVNYSVHQWNHTPRPDLGFMTPTEKFQGIDFDCRSAKTKHFSASLHPFGCPVFVLDEQLQKGQTIPKFGKRSRVGIFMGHSSHHSDNVYLVLNPETDYITPQYHVVFDNKFQTVDIEKSTDSWKIWDTLAEFNRQHPKPYIDLQLPSFEKRSPEGGVTSLHNEHLPVHTKQSQPLKKASMSPPEGDIQPSHDDVPKDEAQQSHNIDFRTLLKNVRFKLPSSPQSNKHSNKTSGSKKTDSRHKMHAKAKRKYNKKQYIPDPTQRTISTGARRSTRTKHRSKRAREAARDQAIQAMLATYDKLNKLEPNLNKLSFTEQIDRIQNLASTVEGEFSDLCPWALAASANPNILSHSQAKRADDWEEFVKAMKDEINRMIKNNIFKLVKKSIVPINQRILRAVWSHRRKTTPSGEVYRHRSRLCVDGSQQQHGVDYTETYSPVVSWTTVRILMILAKIFGLHMRQVDYVQAFPQAYLPEGENVFMEIPDGYDMGDKDKHDYCLQLVKNCYGLKQAAYNWNNLLKSGLISLGFKASEHDPCLYIKEDVICVIYVDDTLFFSKDPSKVDKVISNLQKLNFELTDEGDVDAFLGIKVEQLPDGTINMTQPELINRVITTLGLDGESKQHKVPAVSRPLHAHKDGAEREKKWNYRSVIGMLTYISRNTRPDIEYAVHQCARFQLNPKKAHENAVTRIGRYLLGTRNKGLHFKPDMSKLENLECYVDADFAGNYMKEINDDPASCKSRTGCVIKYAGCPIHWFSRMQSEISLSTTEAEYIALSTAARELLPMRHLLSEIALTMNIITKAPNVNCTLFEDNIGAETLAKAPKMNPRTKHIAIKYHFFREAVKSNILRIRRIDTKKQLADIFTKPTPLSTLEPLRKEIMGWLTMFKRNVNENVDHLGISCNLACIN